MQFIRAHQSEAIAAITATLSRSLSEHKNVLWLVSGGSNIEIEKAIMNALYYTHPEELHRLAILPMDERFGPQGHPNSTIAQLLHGNFEKGDATVIDVLVHNAPFEETVTLYGAVASTVINQADTIIGLFGIGADGHTAGILPESPAVHIEDRVIVGYEWTDYTRMTLSMEALERCSVAFALAYGDEKQQALERLRRNKLSVAKLPAKILYTVPTTYVFNEFTQGIV